MTTLLEQIEREQDLERSTDFWHRELMTDQAELVDALGEPDMMATWLIDLLKHAEALETDKAFFAAAKALDVGPAFHTLFAARQLRVTMSRYMEKRAQRMAEA